MELTPQRLFDYASNFADRAEKRGEGTQWPTFRRIAKSMKVRYSDIQDAVDNYDGEDYLGVGIGVCIQGVGYAEHERQGDYVVEAY